MLTIGKCECRFISTRKPLGRRRDLISPAPPPDFFSASRGAAPGRENRHLVEPLRHEISPGDVADLFGRHLLNVFHVDFLELRIAGAKKIAAQAQGGLLNRLLAQDHFHGLLFFGPFQFGRGHQFVAQPIHLAEDFLGGFGLLGRLANGGHGKVTLHVIGRLARRTDRQDQLAIVLQTADQARTFAFAE